MKWIAIIAICLFSCRPTQRVTIEVSQENSDPIGVFEGGNMIYLKSSDYDSAILVKPDGKIVFQKKGCPDMPITKDEAVLKLRSMKQQYFTKYFTKTI